ncbi:MAG: hypothetical protein ACKOPM_00780 [Novosphingobium sp.]
MSEVIAALLGAIAAGLVQTWLNFRTRKHETETILVAIAAEVDSVCRLIRVQQYQGAIDAAIQQLQIPNAQPLTVVVDLKADYFTVYSALSSQIGRLKPSHALKIVNFYAFCKAAIDSTRPEGTMVGEARLEILHGNLQVVALLIDAILRLGDEIVQMPETPIHGELSVPQ